MNFSFFFNKKSFKFSRQLESLDCAPACLKMIAEYHGRLYSLEYLRNLCKTNRLGTSIFSLNSGAKQIGLQSVPATIKKENLLSDLPYPAVLLWNKSHFVILVRVIEKNSNRIFVLADPAFGMLKLSENEFLRKWCDDTGQGVIVFFEPTDDFHTIPDEILSKKNSKTYLNHITKILYRNKIGLLYVLFGMVLSSVISMAFPILTQRLVDVGIAFKNNDFVVLILLFQLGLFLSMTTIDAIRSWILLHIGTKIQIHLTFDLLTKLMKLPLYFFDIKVSGDIMQRTSDNARIEAFIREKLLDFVISIGSLISLSFLILKYDVRIFLFFILGGVMSMIWTVYFIRKKEILDYRKSDINAENDNNLIDTISAMPEIKLNNAEKIKRSNWLKIQVKLFEVNAQILRFQQYQNSGFSSINQLKNIVITFLAAHEVIEGTLSVGEMLGLSMIVGQLNLPIFQSHVGQFQRSWLQNALS